MAGYNKLKGLLVERGIKQTEIANLLNLNRSRFNRIINGQGRELKTSEVSMICRHLNISADEYFFDR